MFKVFIATAFSLPLAATPALAQERGFYIGGNAGTVVKAETDQAYVPATVAGTNGQISTDHELGWSGAIFAGYDFGRVRIEAETGSVSAGIDKITTSFPVGGTPQGSHKADGKVTARTNMINIVLDVANFDDVQIFAGAGAGRAKIDVSEMTFGSGPPLLDDKDPQWRSAWQAIAGVRKPLGEHVEGHLRYVYLKVEDAEMTGFGGRAVTTGLTSHAVLAGFSYRF